MLFCYYMRAFQKKRQNVHVGVQLSWLEHLPCKQGVSGSNPLTSTTFISGTFLYLCHSRTPNSLHFANFWHIQDCSSAGQSTTLIRCSDPSLLSPTTVVKVVKTNIQDCSSAGQSTTLIRWGSVVRVHSILPNLRAKFALIFLSKKWLKPSNFGHFRTLTKF